MYRPPSRPPKGAWARHLHQQRRERNLSQTQAFDIVWEGLRLSRSSRAVYAAIDMGDRQPREDEAEFLASVFGWPAEEDAEQPVETADQSAILAAIDRQTAMLERVLTAITGQMIPPDRLMALETWMDWMAANPSQPQRSPRRPAKQRSAPTL